MQYQDIRLMMEQVCDLVIANLERINSTRYDIEIKKDGTPVTQSDLYVEQLIRNEIRKLIPDATFIGEESFDFQNVNDNGYLVFLDPIDGTENFCSGLKEWGVSFSIWKSHQHLGSFLLFPELGLRLISGDKIEKVHSRITGISSSMSESLLEVMRSPGEFRIMGCAAYNIYNLIHGSFMRFVNPKGAYVWDLLPGIMLAMEHGCKIYVNDELYDGQLLDPTKKYRIDMISNN